MIATMFNFKLPRSCARMVSFARRLALVPLLVVTSGLAISLASAAVPPPAAPPKEKRAADAPHFAGKRAVATRVDVALELLKLETALADALAAGTLDDATQVSVNKSFDGLTGLFFAGRNAEAIDRLQQLAEIVARTIRTPLQRALDATKIEIEPTVWPQDGQWPKLASTVQAAALPAAAADVPSEAPVAMLRLRQLHGGGDVALLAGKTVTVSVEPAEPLGSDRPAARPRSAVDAKAAAVSHVILATLVIPADEGDHLRIELPLSRAAANALALALPAQNMRITLSIAGEPEIRHDAARFQVVPHSLPVFSAAARARLAALPPASISPLVRETLASRIDLASATPASAEAGRNLLSLGALQRELDFELAEAAQGRDPYLHRAGTWQFTLGPDRGDVPVWVHGLSQRTGSHQRPGLLIALHGAGGDEAMFPLSYGAGVIRQLCDQNNLVLLSPKTEPLMGSTALFDALIARAALHYDVDPTRIYVLGHSMGAMATASLASQRPLTIAAAACIAGGPLGQPPLGLPRLPEMLVIGAELDGLVGAKRLESVCARWAGAGLPVRFKLAPGLGHTLCVGHELPLAIAFLITQSMPGGTPPHSLESLPPKEAP